MVHPLVQLQQIDVEISEITKSASKRRKKVNQRSVTRKLNGINKNRTLLLDSIDTIIALILGQE